MYNTSLRIVKDTFEAEDIMQEAFLKAFQSLSSYKAEANFGLWLKRIVVNLSLDSLRKKKPEIENILNTQELVINESENEDENESNTNYEIEKIKDEINKLPDGYRIVLSLYLLEGYDHDEISEVLKISASTSRSQYTRAKKKLIENLKFIKNEQVGRSN